MTETEKRLERIAASLEAIAKTHEITAYPVRSISIGEPLSAGRRRARLDAILSDLVWVALLATNLRMGFTSSRLHLIYLLMTWIAVGATLYDAIRWWQERRREPGTPARTSAL